MPKVSVIIPNYNHAPYLNWRIDTVLGQTYRDFDVLVLDDHSTDNSRNVIETYRGRTGVTIAFADHNSGSVFRQWERGIAQTTGEYIWIAESDDWADPRFLERLVPILDANPLVGVAYCQSWIVDRSFQVTGNAICWTEDLAPGRWKSDFINSGPQEIRNYLLYRNTIPNASAALQRRRVLDQVRPIETDFRLCGDWMHWIRMLTKGDVAFVAENLNFWRFHSSNARTAPPGILEWQEGERVLDSACKLMELDASERDRILLRFLRQCWAWLAEFVHTPRS